MHKNDDSVDQYLESFYILSTAIAYWCVIDAKIFFERPSLRQEWNNVESYDTIG